MNSIINQLELHELQLQAKSKAPNMTSTGKSHAVLPEQQLLS